MMLLSHIGPRLDEEHEDLASFEELIGFLTLHLDFETTKTVEYCGNKHILCPDSDTSAFVRFVKSEVEQKLKNEREKLNVVIETMISDYQKQIRNSAVLFESVRIAAGNKLIEDLEGMIPEPKRSNFKEKTLRMTKEDLEDYVSDLREELSGYIDDRESEILQNLRVLLGNFRNDLFALSRQLRVVSKIGLLLEELGRENIPQEEKEKIHEIAEAIENVLKKKIFSPAMMENISEFTGRTKILAEKETSRRFKKAAKALENTVSYLFGEYGKDHWK